MKYLLISFSVLLFSCGLSKEEKEIEAKKIAVEKADEYCECKSNTSNDSENDCFFEIRMALEKELIKLDLEEDSHKKALSDFDLVKQVCDLKN